MKKLISLLLALTLIFGTQAAFAYDLGQRTDFEPKTFRDSLIISSPVYSADGNAITNLSNCSGKTVT